MANGGSSFGGMCLCDVHFLVQIRYGICDDEVVATIKQCEGNQRKDDLVQPTRLYALNRSVDAENSRWVCSSQVHARRSKANKQNKPQTLREFVKLPGTITTFKSWDQYRGPEGA